MIDFLYFGEANVYQENLDSFLAVAEELQLKGLMGSGAEEEAEESNKPTKKKSQKSVQQKSFRQQDALTPNISESLAKVKPSPPIEGTVAVTDYTVAADHGRARICKVCGKE